MRIYSLIQQLINYAKENSLIGNLDEIYVRNQFMHLLNLKDWKEIECEAGIPEFPQDILDDITNYCVVENIIEDTISSREVFDTHLMGILTPMPSKINSEFKNRYLKDARKATDDYYLFSKKTNYIRTKSIDKNLKWLSPSKYGDLEITINLSKPEKDPKDIEKQKLLPQTSYPKCLLCYENVGYFGNANHPSRNNHRVIPFDIEKEEWFLQYSPYIYYNEHSILFSKVHRPMIIDEKTFLNITDFITQLPHYFLGSNADLPIVGGSILSHDHYQGGNHEFPMSKADFTDKLKFDGFENVDAGIVNWPMSVIRIRSSNRIELSYLANKILGIWRDYSDESCDILSHTKETPHNTITPIGRIRKGKYEFDLVLRNNRTSKEHPFGIFHPHSEYHNIKKENIGLIEVMGLAVLPGRLKAEIEILKDYILKENTISNVEKDENVSKHINFVKIILDKYKNIEKDTIDDIIREEIGLVFSHVLENAGVYKKDENGKKGFLKFIEFVNGRL